MKTINEWQENGLKERCSRRATELGKTLAEVLEAAGMGHDTLDRVPPRGRRTDTLSKLARELDWSLAQVMGIEKKLQVRLNAAHVAEAAAMTRRLLEPYFSPVPAAKYYEELTAILNLLIACIIDDREVDDGYLRGIEATLRDLPRAR